MITQCEKIFDELVEEINMMITLRECMVENRNRICQQLGMTSWWRLLRQNNLCLTISAIDHEINDLTRKIILKQKLKFDFLKNKLEMAVIEKKLKIDFDEKEKENV
jgi:hypothetical protein